MEFLILTKFTCNFNKYNIVRSKEFKYQTFGTKNNANDYRKIQVTGVG